MCFFGLQLTFESITNLNICEDLEQFIKTTIIDGAAYKAQGEVFYLFYEFLLTYRLFVLTFFFFPYAWVYLYNLCQSCKKIKLRKSNKGNKTSYHEENMSQQSDETVVIDSDTQGSD